MPAVMGENLPALFDSHKDIWEFVQDYYETNKSLPPVEIVEEEFDGFKVIQGLKGATKHYIKAHKENMANILLNQMLEGALKTVKGKEQKAADIVNRLNRKLNEISRSTGIIHSVDVRNTEDAESYYDRVREQAARNGGRPGIAFGFKEMDKHYPTGMAPGHFIVQMGYSGLGKTWFAIKIAINAWEQGYDVLMINLEMTPEELRNRIYFLISHYSMDELVRAEIDPDSFRQWSKEYMEGKSAFHIVGAQGGEFTTAMVQQKIEQYQPSLVVLDYMQLFWDKNLSIQDTARAKNVSSEFKAVAMQTAVPILVITAVTGKDKKDRINPPEIAQVAWSSQIEYDANLCYAVHTHRNPVTQKAESTEIVCRKNRHGELFSFRVNMDLNIGVIEELAPEDIAKFIDAEDSEFAAIFDDPEERDLPQVTVEPTSQIMSIQQEQMG